MGTYDSPFYSSTPFKPRQFTSTGTAFIHYKSPEEKDADGETTFPPTKSPTMQFNGWFSPTESPSRVPTKYPATLDPSNVGEVTWHPSKKPTSNPSHQPTSNPSRFPTKEPSREPTKIPTKVSSGPSELPTREPSKGVRSVCNYSIFIISARRILTTSRFCSLFPAKQIAHSRSIEESVSKANQ